MALGYVRPARPEDAGEISRIQLATWRTAYRRILPRHALAQLDEEFLGARWLEAITAPPSPRHRVLVAIEQADQSYLVGFVASGPADADAMLPSDTVLPSDGPVPTDTVLPSDGPIPTDAMLPSDGPIPTDAMLPSDGPIPTAAGPVTVAAVTELMVEPRWGRRGHGSRLLAASVDLWRADGFTTAVAWAYQQDPAMLRFLGSAGWRPDGARRALDVDDQLVPQLRLHTGLLADEPPAGGPSGDEPPADEAQGDDRSRETDGPATGG